MIRRAFHVLVMSAWMAGSAPIALSAQESNGPLWQVFTIHPLANITALPVIVGLSGEDQRCGVTEDALRLAATRALLDGGIRVLQVGIGASPTLYVSSVVLEHTGGCSSSVGIELAHNGWFEPNQFRSTNGLGVIFLEMSLAKGALSVENRSTLLVGPRSDFADRVRASVRRFTEELVTKIKLANQK